MPGMMWVSAGSVAFASVLFSGTLGGLPANPPTEYWDEQLAAVTPDTVRRSQSYVACAARELSRAPLQVEGGRELYLEPRVVSVSGDHILLAGKPSYLFRNRDAGATAELESRHAVFGAVIAPDGSARTVALPPINEGKVAPVAATATSPGAWRVIFGELDSVAVQPQQTVGAFWHGIYDGQQWSSLERLPHDPKAPPMYFNPSGLAQSGDTVVWMALAAIGSYQERAVIFERTNGAWSHHLIPSTPASRVELIHTGENGFAPAVIRKVLRAAGDAGGFLPGSQPTGPKLDSIILYRRGPEGWGVHRAILPGRIAGLSRVPIDSTRDGYTVSWMTAIPGDGLARMELRAMSGALGERDEPVIVVDRHIAQGFATATLPDGEMLWVTDHYLPSTRTHELRLIQRHGDSTAVIWQAPQPFRGPFRVVSYSGSDVIVVGPELNMEKQLLVSLLLRIRLDCPPKQPAD